MQNAKHTDIKSPLDLIGVFARGDNRKSVTLRVIQAHDPNYKTPSLTDIPSEHCVARMISEIPIEQSDWLVNDMASPAYIRNKPRITSTQSDWFTEDELDGAYIWNKPTIRTDLGSTQYMLIGKCGFDDENKPVNAVVISAGTDAQTAGISHIVNVGSDNDIRERSIAVGSTITSANGSAIGIGDRLRVNSPYSVLIGYLLNASVGAGGGSLGGNVIIGRNVNMSNADNSVDIGNNSNNGLNRVSTQYIQIGSDNEVSTQSITHGWSNSAQITNSFIAGSDNLGNGNDAVVIGTSNNTMFSSNIAIGLSNNANGGDLLIGTDNATYADGPRDVSYGQNALLIGYDNKFGKSAYGCMIGRKNIHSPLAPIGLGSCEGSYIIGYENTVGKFTNIFGGLNKVNMPKSTAIGDNNDISIPGIFITPAYNAVVGYENVINNALSSYVVGRSNNIINSVNYRDILIYGNTNNATNITESTILGARNTITNTDYTRGLVITGQDNIINNASDSLILGSLNTINSSDTIVVGNNNTAGDTDYSITIGSDCDTSGSISCVTIGHGIVADSHNGHSVVIGGYTNSADTRKINNVVSIGSSELTQHLDKYVLAHAVTIGHNVTTNGGVAIGCNAKAIQTDSSARVSPHIPVAIGGTNQVVGFECTAQDGIVIGLGHAENSVILTPGPHNFSLSTVNSAFSGSVLIGTRLNNSAGSSQIAIGSTISVTGSSMIAIGSSVSAALFSVSVGFSSDAEERCVAIGEHASAIGFSNIAIGKSARANNDNRIQLGSNSINPTTDSSMSTLLSVYNTPLLEKADINMLLSDVSDIRIKPNLINILNDNRKHEYKAIGNISLTTPDYDELSQIKDRVISIQGSGYEFRESVKQKMSLIDKNIATYKVHGTSSNDSIVSYTFDDISKHGKTAIIYGKMKFLVNNFAYQTYQLVSTIGGSSLCVEFNKNPLATDMSYLYLVVWDQNGVETLRHQINDASPCFGGNLSFRLTISGNNIEIVAHGDKANSEFTHTLTGNQSGFTMFRHWKQSATFGREFPNQPAVLIGDIICVNIATDFNENFLHVVPNYRMFCEGSVDYIINNNQSSDDSIVTLTKFKDGSAQYGVNTIGGTLIHIPIEYD